MVSIIRNYISTKSPISNKYLNHGKNVPIQKYPYVKFSLKPLTHVRTYSTHNNNKPNTDDLNSNNNAITATPAKIYNNAYTMRKIIICENKGKSAWRQAPLVYICELIYLQVTYM